MVPVALVCIFLVLMPQRTGGEGTVSPSLIPSSGAISGHSENKSTDSSYEENGALLLESTQFPETIKDFASSHVSASGRVGQEINKSLDELITRTTPRARTPHPTPPEGPAARETSSRVAAGPSLGVPHIHAGREPHRYVSNSRLNESTDGEKVTTDSPEVLVSPEKNPQRNSSFELSRAVFENLIIEEQDAVKLPRSRPSVNRSAEESLKKEGGVVSVSEWGDDGSILNKSDQYSGFNGLSDFNATLSNSHIDVSDEVNSAPNNTKGLNVGEKKDNSTLINTKNEGLYSEGNNLKLNNTKSLSVGQEDKNSTVNNTKSVGEEQATGSTNVTQELDTVQQTRRQQLIRRLLKEQLRLRTLKQATRRQQEHENRHTNFTSDSPGQNKSRSGRLLPHKLEENHLNNNLWRPGSGKDRVEQQRGEAGFRDQNSVLLRQSSGRKELLEERKAPREGLICYCNLSWCALRGYTCRSRAGACYVKRYYDQHGYGSNLLHLYGCIETLSRTERETCRETAGDTRRTDAPAVAPPSEAAGGTLTAGATPSAGATPAAVATSTPVATSAPGATPAAVATPAAGGISPARGPVMAETNGTKINPQFPKDHKLHWRLNPSVSEAPASVTFMASKDSTPLKKHEPSPLNSNVIYIVTDPSSNVKPQKNTKKTSDKPKTEAPSLKVMRPTITKHVDVTINKGKTGLEVRDQRRPIFKLPTSASGEETREYRPPELLCCASDVCNYERSAYSATVGPGTRGRTRLQGGTRQSSYSSSGWFRAAAVAVPAVGAAVLAVLVCLALRLLRGAAPAGCGKARHTCRYHKASQHDDGLYFSSRLPFARDAEGRFVRPVDPSDFLVAPTKNLSYSISRNLSSEKLPVSNPFSYEKVLQSYCYLPSSEYADHNQPGVHDSFKSRSPDISKGVSVEFKPPPSQGWYPDLPPLEICERRMTSFDSAKRQKLMTDSRTLPSACRPSNFNQPPLNSKKPSQPGSFGCRRSQSGISARQTQPNEVVFRCQSTSPPPYRIHDHRDKSSQTSPTIPVSGNYLHHSNGGGDGSYGDAKGNFSVNVQPHANSEELFLPERIYENLPLQRVCDYFKRNGKLGGGDFRGNMQAETSTCLRETCPDELESKPPVLLDDSPCLSPTKSLEFSFPSPPSPLLSRSVTEVEGTSVIPPSNSDELPAAAAAPTPCGELASPMVVATPCLSPASSPSSSSASSPSSPVSSAAVHSDLANTNSRDSLAPTFSALKLGLPCAADVKGLGLTASDIPVTPESSSPGFTPEMHPSLMSSTPTQNSSTFSVPNPDLALPSTFDPAIPVTNTVLPPTVPGSVTSPSSSPSHSNINLPQSLAQSPEKQSTIKKIKDEIEGYIHSMFQEDEELSTDSNKADKLANIPDSHEQRELRDHNPGDLTSVLPVTSDTQNKEANSSNRNVKIATTRGEDFVPLLLENELLPNNQTIKPTATQIMSASESKSSEFVPESSDSFGKRISPSSPKALTQPFKHVSSFKVA